VTRWSNRLVLGLVGYQVADAAFNAVALYDIADSTRWGNWAKEWAKDDLDHLRFPERFRFLFPIIKSSSAAGLLVGLRWRRLGRFTAAALVAYFVIALGFHRRAKDPLNKFGPAAVMLLWSCVVLRALSIAEPVT
jgi:hypothetical protein